MPIIFTSRNLVVYTRPAKMDPNPKTASRVFLNPNFKNTHINPNFFKPKAPGSIHINPEFLERLKTPEVPSQPAPEKLQGKIIAKSRTKLVREPSSTTAVTQNLPAVARSPLIKIGPRKLVRASLVKAKSTSVEQGKICNAHISPTKGRYKIDRRISRAQITKPDHRKLFVSKYALSRAVEVLEALTPKKVTETNRRTCRLEKSLNEGGTLLNINGVLYKSTKTKLLKTSGNLKQEERPLLRNQVPGKPSTGERVLFVRGNKFVLDKTGHNLTRVQTKNADGMRLKRIDIGGLTYVANSQNTLTRTDIHRARNHLSSAKHKSINLLSQRLVKSNVPCPIFRKVGKCAAFERGRCPKVHDKKQVAICPRFLKGECISDKCLLSHDVTLAKMPTCKFFLQGCCVRSECPYLHKKLNEKTEICLDFLKGFCNLADKCNKRHEFLCPEFESKGKCERVRCLHVHRKESAVKAITVSNTKTDQTASSSGSTKKTRVEVATTAKLNSRYFGESRSKKIDDDNDAKNNAMLTSSDETDPEKNTNDTANTEIGTGPLRTRTKLGELPAFIPL